MATVTHAIILEWVCKRFSFCIVKCNKFAYEQGWKSGICTVSVHPYKVSVISAKLISQKPEKAYKSKFGCTKPIYSAFWFSQPVNLVPSNVQFFFEKLMC